MCEASRTEYWRSHSRKTISREGILVVPANRTKDEPKDSREISLYDLDEATACDVEVRADREARRIGSAIVVALIESLTYWRWNEFQTPDRASQTGNQQRSIKRIERGAY